MNEQDLLKDCLERLNRTGVAYMVTGSMASNFWGIPRSTRDLDFAIQLPPTAVPKVVAAFTGDFYIDETAIKAAYRPPVVRHSHAGRSNSDWGVVESKDGRVIRVQFMPD